MRVWRHSPIFSPDWVTKYSYYLEYKFVGIWWKERLEIFRKYFRQEASPLGREYFYQPSFRPSAVRCPSV